MLTLEELKARLGAPYVEGFGDLAAGALADAIGIAEGYIGTRYPLPLAQVPGLVRAAITDLAHAGFYLTDTPEDVLTKARDARALLAAIGAGKVVLALPQPQPPAGELPDEGVLFEAAPLKLSLAQTGLVF